MADAIIAPRFEMYIAGSLLEGITEQPVTNVHDMLVVGIEFAGATKLHQLFEISDVAELALVVDNAHTRYRPVGSAVVFHYYW